MFIIFYLSKVIGCVPRVLFLPVFVSFALLLETMLSFALLLETMLALYILYIALSS
jgi:hypothetical protein